MSKSKGVGISAKMEMEVLGKSIEFVACVAEIGNSGIGPYEYWGAKGVDKGRDYVENFAVAEIKAGEGVRTLSGEEIKDIEHFLLTDDEAIKRIEEELNEALANCDPEDDGDVAYDQSVDDAITGDRPDPPELDESEG
jgi:hypothetical protein